jgi:hypothetical protein
MATIVGHALFCPKQALCLSISPMPCLPLPAP